MHNLYIYRKKKKGGPIVGLGGKFTNVKQLFRQRFDAYVNKSLMK
jgi:hypothetical protein